MRDYTRPTEDDRGLAVDYRYSFGEGLDSDNGYYELGQGLYIIVGDTKNEIIQKLGLPDNIDKMPDTSECWVYMSKEIKLYFMSDRLDSWEKTDKYEQ
ncbi:MAG: hypothetical protein PHP69_03515 [Candidatus Omnitrophica bacterium]|jgi:hypothetical protein|nr:hypothetical protein [Candidatus Omnitrophota bacterium]MDD5081140.1 hypothetical protein [Candidatus Omnitrophota bacterium]MDD5441005.1 hypothetical protein [Candidatus Omnitrophota bacterium]